MEQLLQTWETQNTRSWTEKISEIIRKGRKRKKSGRKNYQLIPNLISMKFNSARRRRKHLNQAFLSLALVDGCETFRTPMNEINIELILPLFSITWCSDDWNVSKSPRWEEMFYDNWDGKWFYFASLSYKS